MTVQEPEEDSKGMLSKIKFLFNLTTICKKVIPDVGIVLESKCLFYLLSNNIKKYAAQMTNDC